MQNVINDHFTLRLIVVIALGTATTILMLQQSVYAYTLVLAGPAITGENIYVAWLTNDTANKNEEIISRASIDGGKNFGEEINLSNTTASNSTRIEIDLDAESGFVTWRQTNETDNTPVIRVSSEDFWKTFGSLLELSTNETIEEDG